MTTEYTFKVESKFYDQLIIAFWFVSIGLAAACIYIYSQRIYPLLYLSAFIEVLVIIALFASTKQKKLLQKSTKRLEEMITKGNYIDDFLATIIVEEGEFSGIKTGDQRLYLPENGYLHEYSTFPFRVYFFYLDQGSEKPEIMVVNFLDNYYFYTNDLQKIKEL